MRTLLPAAPDLRASGAACAQGLLFLTYLGVSSLTTFPNKRPPSASPDEPCGLRGETDALLLLALLEKQLELLTADLSDGTNLPKSRIPTQLQSQLEPEPLREGPSEIRTATAEDIKASTARLKGPGRAQGHLHPASVCPEAPPVYPALHHMGCRLAILSLLLFSVCPMHANPLSPMKSNTVQVGTTSSGLVLPLWKLTIC